MKAKYLFLTLFAFVFLFAMTSMAAETVAVVLKVKGSVSLVRGNATAAQKLNRGFRLEHGDKLSTGSKGYAAIKFVDDASVIRVRANSTCRIEGKKEKNQILKNVYLEVGALFARVTQQKGEFKITTPTSVATIKGTEWISEHKSEGGTFYYGLKGIVEISNNAGVALLHPGETVEVLDANTAPRTRKSYPGEGVWDEEFGLEDDFEFEFENDAGERKILRFNVQTAE
jgi:hypothetical protein